LVKQFLKLLLGASCQWLTPWKAEIRRMEVRSWGNSSPDSISKKTQHGKVLVEQLKCRMPACKHAAQSSNSRTDKKKEKEITLCMEYVAWADTVDLPISFSVCHPMQKIQKQFLCFFLSLTI
jgi:hypothetical protein